MTFDQMVKRRVKLIREIFATKHVEYTPNGNPFENFDKAAVFNNTTPAKALWGMATKHFISVKQICESDKKHSHDFIDEKIGDSINYLILLNGMLDRDNYYESHPNKEVNEYNKKQFDDFVARTIEGLLGTCFNIYAGSCFSKIEIWKRVFSLVKNEEIELSINWLILLEWRFKNND